MKCNICGTEYDATKDNHYIAREQSKTGISEIISHHEERLFDCFDCPNCGCQNIAQTRHRVLFDWNDDETEDEAEDD